MRKTGDATTPSLGAVIFDLDDTLFDCTGQLTTPARRRAATILSHTYPPSFDKALNLQVELSDYVGSTEAIREVGSRFELPGHIIEHALSAYNEPEVPPIILLSGAEDTLAALKHAGIPVALVTTGSPSRQLRKIKRLGLHHIFSERSGTLFLHDPTKHTPDKAPHLLDASSALGVPPERTAVVGDKLDAEIEAGNRLGMFTIRLRHGRQATATPASAHQIPDAEIDNLPNIVELLISPR